MRLFNRKNVAVIRCLGFCFLLGSFSLSLSLFLSLNFSLSFFPGGPAGAGVFFQCCFFSLFSQVPTTSGRPLNGLSSVSFLAPLSASLLLPPSPPSPPVSPPSHCLLFSFFVSFCHSLLTVSLFFFCFFCFSFLFLCPSVRLSTCLPVCLSVCLRVCLSVCLLESARLFGLAVFLFVCLFDCPFVLQSVCPFVCFFLSLPRSLSLSLSRARKVMN